MVHECTQGHLGHGIDRILHDKLFHVFDIAVRGILRARGGPEHPLVIGAPVSEPLELGRREKALMGAVDGKGVGHCCLTEMLPQFPMERFALF